jgi:hypothetical protein
LFQGGFVDSSKWFHRTELPETIEIAVRPRAQPPLASPADLAAAGASAETAFQARQCARGGNK